MATEKRGNSRIRKTGCCWTVFQRSLIVINNSSSPIVVKPEVSGKPLEVLPPGERYTGKHDGVYTKDGRVFKNVNDVDTVVNKDGSVSTRISPDVVSPYERLKRAVAQAILGGWKDDEWLGKRKEEWPSLNNAKEVIDKWYPNLNCP